MNKFAIVALVAVMVAGLFAGCRRNVGTDTTASTTKATTASTAAPSTHATTAPTTQATTRPSETTRPTDNGSNASQPSMPTDMGPTDGNAGSDGKGSRGIMPPRF